jgi:hypothetical protein
MKIAAICYISLSEIQKVKPNLTKQFALDNPAQMELILRQLGMETSMPVEIQDVQHRNKFNEVVDTLRWVGLERGDLAHLSSGYASVEALDRARNNKLLTDLYSYKHMVEE